MKFQRIFGLNTPDAADIVEQYGGPDPLEDPEWWTDTANFDGDLADLF